MKSNAYLDNCFYVDTLYFPIQCLNLRSYLEYAVNGCLPVSSSNIVTPKDHISAEWLYAIFKSTSGAM